MWRTHVDVFSCRQVAVLSNFHLTGVITGIFFFAYGCRRLLYIHSFPDTTGFGGKISRCSKTSAEVKYFFSSSYIEH